MMKKLNLNDIYRYIKSKLYLPGLIIILRQSSEINIQSWVFALKSGIEAIQTHGRSNVGERTMLDPLHAIADTLSNCIEKNIIEVIIIYVNKVF